MKAGELSTTNQLSHVGHVRPAAAPRNVVGAVGNAMANASLFGWPALFLADVLGRLGADV